MKTAGRHSQTNSERPPYATKQATANDPDLIIMSVSHGQKATSHLSHLVTGGEYTDYEEVASSHAYDELAFQEYADEDPTRLKVSSRRNQA
jgi:hypothetical protein